VRCYRSPSCARFERVRATSPLALALFISCPLSPLPAHGECFVWVGDEHTGGAVWFAVAVIPRISGTAGLACELSRRLCSPYRE